MDTKFNYKTQEYPLEYILKHAEGNNYFARILRLNGYADELASDAGEEPRIVN